MPQTKKKTPKKKATPTILNVALVWDMSGSMMYVRDAAVEGATDYINKLRQDEAVESMRFSITAFDTVFETWFQDVPVEELDIDFAKRYHPGGWTALNDAVANQIFEMDKRLVGDRADERVLIVVLTDGKENSSTEFGGPEGTAALAKIVKKREKTGNWTFVYLGTGSPEQVMHAAMSYNIPAGNAAAYSAKSSASARVPFIAMASATVTRSRGASGQSVTVMDDAGLKSVLNQTDDEDQNV